MSNRSRWTIASCCLLCFVLGWVWGQKGTRVQADPTPKQAAPAFSMTARLGNNLFQQTAAEYRACCLQVYQSAAYRLDVILNTTKPAKPAIVMDLDETVLDNSAFQTMLYKKDLEYSDSLWANYEEKFPQEVRLIPGAKSFIEKAEKQGVTVVYISNRTQKFQASTIKALDVLGINVKDIADRMYLKPDGASSDKSARREAVTAKYNVILYFGDNLRDFSETFAVRKPLKEATTEDCLKAIQQRFALTDEAACHWGVDWFVLPNITYGEWEKLIGPDLKGLLLQTKMEPPGDK